MRPWRSRGLEARFDHSAHRGRSRHMTLAVGELAVLDRINAAPPRGLVAASTAVRVVIADGQAVVRAGFRVLLEGDHRIRFVGEAATGEEAVALAHRTRPDVVLVDAGLPGLD